MNLSRLTVERRWQFFFGGTGAIVVIAIVLMLANWHRPLTADAESLLSAMLSGRESVLYEHILPMEKRDGLSGEAVNRVWSQVIRPNIGTFRPVGPITSEISSSEGTSAIDLVTLQDDQGHQADFGVNVRATDGPGQATLSELIYMSWMLHYLDGDGKRNSGSRARTVAAIQGLTADREKLEAIGLRRFYQPHLSAPALSFDEQLREWRARLARYDNDTETHGTQPH